MPDKTCPICQSYHNKRGIYCSRKCYHLAPKSEETREKQSAANKGKPKSQHMRNALSKTVSGKPKTYNRGDKNPNYKGKYTHDPQIYGRICDAAKKRGQPWDDEHRKAHSQKMLGDSNAMRGKRHSIESLEKMSEIKKQQYKDGYVKVNLSKISKPEKEIADYFDSNDIKYKKQFHIKGIPYWYDFYLPDYNLILEYQGDYWHANPNKYPSGTKLKILNKGEKLVDDIWDRDRLKKEAAEQNGYRIKCVWETDYKTRGMDAILSCLN